MNAKDKEKKERIELFMSIHKSKVLPHSWDRVDEIREELQTDTANYPWREAAEELWKGVSYAQMDDELQISRDDRRADSPLEALCSGLEIPRYPPIEVLVSIKEAFYTYLSAEGKLSLEDVFFGPHKKGVGNYSARMAKVNSYKRFHFYVGFGDFTADKAELEAHRNLSLESKAIEFLAHKRMSPAIAKNCKVEPDYDNIPDPESYLRGYRRWKKAETDK